MLNFDLCCNISVLLVMQKAVNRQLQLLQTELDSIKAKLNVQSNTDLLSPARKSKLELLLL